MADIFRKGSVIHNLRSFGVVIPVNGPIQRAEQHQGFTSQGGGLFPLASKKNVFPLRGTMRVGRPERG